MKFSTAADLSPPPEGASNGGVIRETLFGKIDLDTLTTMLVLGIDPAQVACRQVKGSAPGAALADKRVACIETGGAGEVENNNFDHHPQFPLGKGSNLSACAQALRRLARLVDYVDELDRGVRRSEQVEGGGFPSLAQLVSGMLLVVKSPELRLKFGLEILRAVVQSGVDPYGSMEEILDYIPHARWWAQQKRIHERGFKEAVLDKAIWYTTRQGRRLAVVETSWIGAPGALYGHSGSAGYEQGAELVIALNPAMEMVGMKELCRKFTVAGNRIPVTPVVARLNRLEPGWGGPEHGTIIGSRQNGSSCLDLQTVVAAVIEEL